MQSQKPVVEQVGGKHYQAEYQHWDLCDEHNVSYLESCATKYLSRWRDKGGVQDLQKSRSYVEKRLASLSSPGAASGVLQGASNQFEACLATNDYHRNYRQFTMNIWKFKRWCSSIELGSDEAEACFNIFFWETRQHLEQALNIIDGLIASVPTGAYTGQ